MVGLKKITVTFAATALAFTMLSGDKLGILDKGLAMAMSARKQGGEPQGADAMLSARRAAVFLLPDIHHFPCLNIATPMLSDRSRNASVFCLRGDESCTHVGEIGANCLGGENAWAIGNSPG